MAHLRMSREAPGHTLQTTALVHEALMRMTSAGHITAVDRPEFFRAAAVTMRRILIDHARANLADKRGGGRRRVPLGGLNLPTSGVPENSLDLLALDEAILRLDQQSPDAGTVVRLRFYAGLSVAETAEATGQSARTIDRLWSFARAWLWRELNESGDPDAAAAAAAASPPAAPPAVTPAATPAPTVKHEGRARP